MTQGPLLPHSDSEARVTQEEQQQTPWHLGLYGIICVTTVTFNGEGRYLETETGQDSSPAGRCCPPLDE